MRSDPPLTSQTSGQVVVRVVGEIDAATAPLFAERLDEVIEADHRNVAVDLAELTFMDSAGLVVLIHGRQRLERTGRRMLIAHPSPTIVRLLEIAGLDEWFDMEPSPPRPQTVARGGVKTDVATESKETVRQG
jgi:anti-sigma B factor antagonist